MTLIALKLILAHFLGDFALQPSKWVTHKRANTFRSKYLYWHMGVHLVLLLVLLQLQYLWAVAIIIISHYLIDLGKLLLRDDRNHRWLFLVDQFLHLAVIAGVVYGITPYELNLEFLSSKSTLLLLTCIVFVTFVAAIVMKLLLAPYIKEIAEDDNGEGASLRDAGKYIGMLERLFVFGFILGNQWAAIGLLIAAKSVFRFGDLNKGKNRKLTEYVLIGTLLSFGLAILTGIGYHALLTIL